MSALELSILYLCVGATLGIVAFKRGQGWGTLLIALFAWPLGAAVGLLRHARKPEERMADRIDAALREGVEATRGTSLGRVLSEEQRVRIVAEVSATEARCRQLGDALAHERLDVEKVERLRGLLENDLATLKELADIAESLKSQLVLARFAGSKVDGASAIVPELWNRVENLRKVMAVNLDAFGGAFDARLGGRRRSAHP